MHGEDFEWDDAKAAKNFQVHKITFEMARDVFADPFVIEWVDEGHGDKTSSVSLPLEIVDGRVLFVSYTLRGDAIRIISARRAEARERRRYYNENKT